MAMIKRAEIDTTAPFASVREAVALFGERVLAGRVVYANNIIVNNKEDATDRNANTKASRIGAVTAELQQTKQSLEKAREESLKMADSLSSLKQELETTRRQLRKVIKETRPPPETPPLMEIVEDSSGKFKSTATETTSPEFQKQRYVTFANPPCKVVEPPPPPEGAEERQLERHPSLRKKLTNKKKALMIPLIGGIFAFGKRKQSHQLP